VVVLILAHGHVYAVDCGIAQVPGWLTRDNIGTVVVLILAMLYHYHFIRTRLLAQTEEAIKVIVLLVFS
jgi:hypothetical protein